MEVQESKNNTILHAPKIRNPVLHLRQTAREQAPSKSDVSAGFRDGGLEACQD